MAPSPVVPTGLGTPRRQLSLWGPWWPFFLSSSLMPFLSHGVTARSSGALVSFVHVPVDNAWSQAQTWAPRGAPAHLGVGRGGGGLLPLPACFLLLAVSACSRAAVGRASGTEQGSPSRPSRHPAPLWGSPGGGSVFCWRQCFVTCPGLPEFLGPVTEWKGASSASVSACSAGLWLCAQLGLPAPRGHAAPRCRLGRGVATSAPSLGFFSQLTHNITSVSGKLFIFEIFSHHLCSLSSQVSVDRVEF